MDPIGIVPPVTTPPPTIPLVSAPATATSNPSIPLDKVAASAEVTPQAVDQKRVDAIQQAARQIANIYVVSDQSFTIYKDATGQYITRYISLRDGKVTYIPEPSLFKLGGSTGAPVLKIQA